MVGPFFLRKVVPKTSADRIPLGVPDLRVMEWSAMVQVARFVLLARVHCNPPEIPPTTWFSLQFSGCWTDPITL